MARVRTVPLSEETRKLLETPLIFAGTGPSKATSKSEQNSKPPSKKGKRPKRTGKKRQPSSKKKQQPQGVLSKEELAPLLKLARMNDLGLVPLDPEPVVDRPLPEE